jgi:hypothetical protein
MTVSNADGSQVELVRRVGAQLPLRYFDRVVLRRRRGPNASLELALAERRDDPAPLVERIRVIACEVTRSRVPLS